MKLKKTVTTNTANANSVNAIATLAENIQTGSGRTEAGQIETRAHIITVPTYDFNAHGNNIRIAIGYGDDHIQITENTYAFDNAAIGYLGRLSFLQVKLAAYQEKRAQDKTTAHKSEFPFRYDELLLSETAQMDNVLAATTTYTPAYDSMCGWLLSQPGANGRTTNFTYDGLGRVIREDRSDDTQAKTISFDRLHRLTNAIAVGASTAAVHCNDLGTRTNCTSNPGLGDVSAYSYVTDTNRMQRHLLDEHTHNLLLA